MAMRSRYAHVDTIIENRATAEDMGLAKKKSFSILLMDAVDRVKRMPVGEGVRLSKDIPVGTLSGCWSYLKQDGDINGEVEWLCHKGRLYIRRKE